VFQDYIIQQVRTYVPVGVGALLTWLLSLGVNVGAEAQVGLVTGGTALVTAMYFTLASALQRKWPVAGRFLLGSKATPTYENVARIRYASGGTITPYRIEDNQ